VSFSNNILIIKKMKSKILILGFLFIVAFFINCRKEKHSCATCFDSVTWNSYGEWTLQGEGGNGSSEGFEGLDATNLVSNCGWEVIQDTTISGLGIYEVQSCEGGVLFYWFDEEFTVFSVQEGWTGSTKEGIKLGDDTTKFLKAYPYFKHPMYKQPAPKPDTNYVYLEYNNQAEGKFVGAAFTKEGKLFQLYVQQDPHESK
jgi:hypothetical protein